MVDIPEAAKKFGWQSGDLVWQSSGEGEPLFTDAELKALLEANPDVTDEPLGAGTPNSEGEGGLREDGSTAAAVRDDGSPAEDEAPVPLDDDLRQLAEGAPANIVQQIYEEQAHRDALRKPDRDDWDIPEF